MNSSCKMKKFLAIIALCLALVMALAACSAPPEDDGDGGITPPSNEGLKPLVYSEGLSYDQGEKIGTCIITGIGSCTDENLVIPPVINGLRVVGIADGAFKANERTVAKVLFYGDNSDNPDDTINGGADEALTNGVSIKSVDIPYSVTEIGAEAFYGCEALSEISLTSLLKLIGEDAFKETAFYNDPANWSGSALYAESYLLAVEDGFSGEFSVKDGTTVIANRAFYECTGLTGIKISSSVKDIGEQAFYGCTSLTEVDLSNNSIWLRNEAFAGCSSLTTAKIGIDEEIYEYTGSEGWYEGDLASGGTEYKSPTHDANGRPYVDASRIEWRAFANCTQLSTLELGHSLDFIGSHAFAECSELESIVIPGSVGQLSNAFYKNTKLKSVTLEDGIKKIDVQTFCMCTALTEIVLPDSLEVVEDIFFLCGDVLLTFGSGTKRVDATFIEISKFKYKGTMAEWALVDYSKMTEWRTVELEGGMTEHFAVRGPFTVECTDGKVIERNGSQTEDDVLNQINAEGCGETTEEVFNRYKLTRTPTFVLYGIEKNGEDFTFTETYVNELEYCKFARGASLYGLRGYSAGEDGYVTLMRCEDDKWRQTNLNAPMSFPLWQASFSFSDLEYLEDECVYRLTRDDGSRLDLGFKDGELVYMSETFADGRVTRTEIDTYADVTLYDPAVEEIVTDELVDFKTGAITKR